MRRIILLPRKTARKLAYRNHLTRLARYLFLHVCLVFGALLASSCEESSRPGLGFPQTPIAAVDGGGGGGANIDQSGSGGISAAAGNSGFGGISGASALAGSGYDPEGSGTGGQAIAGTGGADSGSGGSGSSPTACTVDADCGNGYCNRGSCSCWSSDEAYCDGHCVSTLWSDEHCGSCGNACTPGEPSCASGTCVCYSPPCGSDVGGSGGTGVSGSGGTGGGDDPPPLIPIQNGCDGYATRFWDCCKPHCGWPNNVPGGMNPMTTCDQANVSNGGDYDATSSCNGGYAYTCYGLVPWTVNDSLAYGYTATSSGDVCGRCYQIQFTGASHNAGDDPGSAAIRGKTMIVQAINVGYDVGGGQFDLLIPGGGVGAFNACSNQWGAWPSELGEQYGGFLSTCKQGGASSHEAIKSCVSQKCTDVLGSRGLSELQAGCQWFVDWLQAADNPALVYKEVLCPSEISGKSGMNRTPLNDINHACEG